MCPSIAALPQLQLGRATPATAALDAALDEADGLVVLAIGPLTTVATVLDQRSRRGLAMPRVVVVGGRRPGQLFQVGPASRWVTSTSSATRTRSTRCSLPRRRSR